MIPEAANLARGMTASAKAAFERTYSLLVDTLGCQPHVKTIYVGFTLGDEMVAAIYPHSDRFEIALALPEDHRSALLLDATHLTWRTMPVSTTVTDAASGREIEPLILEAAARVRSGSHDVNRPPEFFIGRKKRNGG